jgi:hypothetical protein
VGPEPSAEESRQWLGLILDSRLEITDEGDADPLDRFPDATHEVPVTLLW